KSVIEHVLETGQLLLVQDARRDARFAADPYVDRVGVRSILAVPLRNKDHTVGILYFENNLATNAFSDDRIEVFKLLSSGMAVAIANSLLFRAHRRAEDALRLLADASGALSGSLDYGEVLDRLCGLVVPHLADWCLVDVLEQGALRRGGERHADPASL